MPPITTMFDENFSFAAQRSPSLDSSSEATRDSSRSVSPCTTSNPFPLPRLSVTDLAQQFAEQRIQRDSQICYDPCEAYANNDNDADWSIPDAEDEGCNPLRRSQTFPQRPHSPSRRAQRQTSTRLLCTASHHRDISALVARMVQSETQCSITPAEPLVASSPIETEDEGYDSSDDAMVETSRRSSMTNIQSRQEYPRNSALLNGRACVNKKVRLRKEKQYRRPPNGERS